MNIKIGDIVEFGNEAKGYGKVIEITKVEYSQNERRTGKVLYELEIFQKELVLTAMPYKDNKFKSEDEITKVYREIQGSEE